VILHIDKSTDHRNPLKDAGQQRTVQQAVVCSCLVLTSDAWISIESIDISFFDIDVSNRIVSVTPIGLSTFFVFFDTSRPFLFSNVDYS